MENFDLRKYLAENKLLKEDMSLTMDQLEKLANIKSDEFNSSPDKLVDMVMGSVKYNLEKDGTNIENASEDEIDKLRYKWARNKGLLKVKDTFTSMYGKRGVKTNTDKDLLDKILRENKLLKEDELPIEGELIGNEYIIDFDDLGNLWEKRFYEKYGYWHYQSDTEDDENYERYDNIQKETWKEIEDILSVKFGKPIKIKLDR